MNSKLIYTLTIIVLSVISSIAQCDFSLLPDGANCDKAVYLCGNELDGYSNTLPRELREPLNWLGLCNNEGSADNMTWFAFTPCDTVVTLRITPSNCETGAGLQAGLFRRCGFSVDCSPQIQPSVIGALTTFDLTWNKFVPGRVAYLVLDGMAGDVCDYHIEVIQGVDTAPAVDIDESTLDQGHVVGPNSLECKNSGDTVSYSMVLPSCLMNYADNCFPEKINILDSVCFVWNVDNLGSGSYSFVNNDSVGTDVKIVFYGEGADRFRIYVDVNLHPYYGGGCAKGACGRVNDLVVSFGPDEFEDINIELCPGDTALVCGMSITGSQTITCEDTNNPCKTIRYNISEKPFRFDSLGTIYQCTGSSYTFQGVEYTNSGEYLVPDVGQCDLLHHFEIKNVTISASILNGIRQLDCRNGSINLEAGVITDLPDDVKYQWTFLGQNLGTTKTQTLDLPGRYFVRTYIDNGLVQCESTDFVDVTVNKAKPICEFQSPVLNCRRKSGNITYISNSPLQSENWSTPIGQNISGNNFPVDSLFASSGLSCRFQAERVDNGCKLDTLIGVQSDFVHPKVTIQGNDLLTCIINNIPLKFISDLQHDSIRWIRDGNYLNADITYDAKEAGNYLCWVKAARNGCTNEGHKRINEDRIKPSVDLGSDKMWYCNTKEVFASPNVDRGDQFRYQWTQQNGGEIQGNVLDADAIFTKPGNFILKVVNNVNGCTKSDSVRVVENEDVPEDINAVVADPACFGEKTGYIRDLDIIGGFEPYTIKVNGNPLKENYIQDLPAGVYQLEVSDKYECLYRDSIHLFDPVLLTVEEMEDVTVSFNETMDLEVITNYDISEIESIIWRNAKGEIVGEGPYFTFDQVTSQVYEVEVINLNGCAAKTRVRINVDNEVKFIFSNIIKPGSGFNNDKISIKKNNIPVEILQFSIYDRWGTKVYDVPPFAMQHAETREIEWNGIFQGRELQQGVYVVNLQYRDYFGNIQNISTDITLIR